MEHPSSVEVMLMHHFGFYHVVPYLFLALNPLRAIRHEHQLLPTMSNAIKTVLPLLSSLPTAFAVAHRLGGFRAQIFCLLFLKPHGDLFRGSEC